MFLDLADVKNHLRVTGDADDSMLAIYSGAACEYLESIASQEWAEEDVPFPVLAAALLLVGDMYEHRIGQSEVELHENAAVCNLMMPYRVF